MNHPPADEFGPEWNGPLAKTPSRKQAALDILVVAGCSLMYIAASLLGVPILWIIRLVVGVVGLYIIGVLRIRDDRWRDYGVRVDNLWAAGWRVGIWTALSALSIGVLSRALGTQLDGNEWFLALFLYPFWGLVQQFVFQGILHRALLVWIWNRNRACLVNSLIFAGVHIADLRVVGLTLVAGCCWSWFYQRWPNVWVLGISHGLLGGLAYRLLLNVRIGEHLL